MTLDSVYSATIDSTPKPSRRRRFLQWLRRAWVPVSLVLIALAMCTTVTLNHSQQLSRYDEWVYFDAVTKVPSEVVVHQGEYIGRQALEIMSCFGDPYGARGEPCTGPNGDYTNHAAYPLGGKTTADIHTPIYYGITWLAARAIQLVTNLDLLTAARLTGFLWLGSGLIALYALTRLLRINKVVAFGLGLITIGSVSSMFEFTYITTDAPALLVGAGLLYLGIRAAKGTFSPWWLIPLAALATLIKITNLFAVGLVVIYLLAIAIMNWRRRSTAPAGAPPPPRLILVAILMGLAAVTAEAVWLGIRAAISVGPGPDQGVNVPFSIRGVTSQLTTFLGVPPPRTLDGLLTLPFALLTIVAVFGLLLTARGTGTRRALSVALAIAVTLFPPVLVVAFSIALGSAFPVSTRYAAALLPGILVAIGFLLQNRMSRYLLVGYGSVLVVAVIARSFYLA